MASLGRRPHPTACRAWASTACTSSSTGGAYGNIIQYERVIDGERFEFYY